jgi:hypothetical protein
MDVPGVTYTITVPTGKTQTLLFTITGYTIMTPVTGGGSSQGGAFLQDGVKISSAFSSSGAAGSGLLNLPHPANLLKAVTLTQGTYTFKVTYSAWAGNARVNHDPSNYIGYNGDTESMLTKMQVLVYNN